MISTILFDLDGTLLPMDQEVFTEDYFRRLAAKLLPFGYEKDRLIEGIWAGMAAMVKNDGSVSNEEAFWKTFTGLFGEKSKKDLPVFEEYYRTEFQKVAGVCGFNQEAADTVASFKNQGYSLVLATNPIFPAVATESRIRWAGLSPEDFVFYTTYENIGVSKPNPEYYKEIVRRLGCRPQECLMVGNDVEEDMIARTVGMDVFLLTDCLINKKDRALTAFPRGSFRELRDYVNNDMPPAK